MKTTKTWKELYEIEFDRIYKTLSEATKTLVISNPNSCARMVMARLAADAADEKMCLDQN